jgi:hypothetical protein
MVPVVFNEGLPMTNLMKSLAVMVAVLFTTSTAANAQGYSPDANPTSIDSISISLTDAASDACWTNLREVREYAEEKLKIKGYNVVADEGEYTFTIAVNAFRDNQGYCVGSHSISIFKYAVVDGINGIHEIGLLGGHGGRDEDNFNRWVINMISSMIALM